MQRFLQNPLLFKLALLTTICIGLFLLAILLVRKLRRNIQSEAEPARPTLGESGFALATYQGLGQQLREKESELKRLREEQQDAAASSNINEAVLGNLSCGILFFDRAGMVRQANRAVKSLLGYASPFSFHIRDLFRGVTRIKWLDTGEEAQSSVPLVHAMQESLRSAAPFRRVTVDYRSPSGQKRVLGLTASAVKGKGGEIAGLSCLIDDLTEITEVSEQMQRSENFASLGEISAGLANDFKNSLGIVRGHAQKLLKEDSTAATRYYVEKIIAELDSLARIVDEFLEFAGSTKPHH